MKLACDAYQVIVTLISQEGGRIMTITKLSFIVLTVALFTVSLSAIPVETANLQDFLFGSSENTAYDNWISHTVEGVALEDYNQYAPWNVQTRGFGTFVNANTQQLDQWQTVMTYFLMEEFEQAQQQIDQFGFPYEIIQFNDTATDRTYYILREQLNMEYFDDNGDPEQPGIHQHGSFDYGWGIYIFNPSSPNPVHVNIVHPNDDFISVPIATLAFQLWDARYLMIAGTGREVLWTEVGNYTNTKSLSDPSRNANHPFNYGYSLSCGEIRETFGRRELSIQIHSFDHTHSGRKSLQISAGNSAQNYPGLPIRDISGNYLDIANASPYLLFPANSLGAHEDILVTDYYSIHYNDHGCDYLYGEELIPIPNNVNLPGYANSQQFAITNQNWNRYDVFSPFFHIEMAELPNPFIQDEETYKWFYGFNAETRLWDIDNRYTKTIDYYTPWLEHLAEILPAVIALDDGLPPSNPEHLHIANLSANIIYLAWNRSISYDFKTYEILMADEPIDLDNPNYVVLDRNTNMTLAGQAFNQLMIPDLPAVEQRYFRIRAVDYNDNYSEISNEIARFSAQVNNLRAFGYDGFVNIEWNAIYQTDNQGFKVYRSLMGSGIYDLIASYEDHPSLLGSELEDVQYNFTDDTAVNGSRYYYKISSTNPQGFEYTHLFTAAGSPQAIYSLNIENFDGTIQDSVEFGSNPYATDNYDLAYDIIKEDIQEEYFVYATSYHENWDENFQDLQRDIFSFFDPVMLYKTWDIRIKANVLEEDFTISISDNYFRNSEKLYLKCLETNEIVNLEDSNMTVQFSDSDYRYFKLYWGNLLPELRFAETANQYYQAGDVIELNWEANFLHLIETISIALVSPTDTLTIATELPADTNSFTWTVPDDMTRFNNTINVVNHIIDGYNQFNPAPCKIGLAPSSYEFNSSPGWDLVANPFAESIVNAETVFGLGALLFSYDVEEEEFLQLNDFVDGKGLWVHSIFNNHYSHTANLQKEAYTIPLAVGWNLVPNLFLHDIPVKDLAFEIGGLTRSYAEAFAITMIERDFLTFTDNRYEFTTDIPATKAAWVYSHTPGLNLVVKPFISNSNVSPLPFSWRSTIEAAQYDEVTRQNNIDRIIVGSSTTTTESYNRFYDLPKPPAKPISPFSFYLTNENESIPFDKMHREFKQTLVSGEIDSRIWDFSLEIGPELYPINFLRGPSNIPFSFRVVLMIDDIHVVLSPTSNYTYYPQEQVINGQIKVTNENVVSIEETPTIPMLFSNYPNPFVTSSKESRNNGTNIKFFIPNDASVQLEVFNVKGQIVKTLTNERLKAGNHTVGWNGLSSKNEQVAAGIYFYRLTVDKKVVLHQKMLLLRGN